MNGSTISPQGGNGSSALRKYGPIAALATGAVGLATGALTIDLPPWAIEQIRQGGSAIFVLVMVFPGIGYYVPRDVIRGFVKAQQDTAVALGGIKDQMQIMAGQAGQLNEIKDMLSDIQTTQSVHGDRLKTIETRLGDGRRADDT